MVIILFSILLLIAIGQVFVNYKSLFNTIATVLGVTLGVFFIFFVITSRTAESAAAEIETLIYENYRIENEVTDILYEYHKIKYPNGEMSYDPEPSVTLIEYYPEAQNDKDIIELLDKYDWNINLIEYNQKLYDKNVKFTHWLVYFNLF